LKAEDVKIGMKVVPHDKTALKDYCNFGEWLIKAKGKYFKENGFVAVIKDLKDGTYTLNIPESPIGYTFFASDFEPYIDPDATLNKRSLSIRIKKVKFGSKTTIVILADGREGKAVRNPLDVFNSVNGLALAYMRALGQDVKDIDIVVNPERKAEDKPTTPITFEVGEIARIRSNYKNTYGIGEKYLLENDGKCFVIEDISDHTCSAPVKFSVWFKEISCIWPDYMLEKVPQPVRESPHEVVVDGVKYVKEDLK
jgi:hypothetical protein